MGFINPAEPPFEYDEWRRRPHLERIKVARPGLGAERVRHALLRLPALRRQARPLRGRRAAADLGDDRGLGGLGDLGAWWTEPIVFQKAVIWTMLWEVLGLGAGSLPLTLRFSPMIGGVLYWLRPGDDAAAALARAGAADPRHAAHALRRRRSTPGCSPPRSTCCSPTASDAVGGMSPAASTRSRSASCSPCSACSGCATRCPFLAARAEIYGNLTIVFLFPLTNMIVAAQLVFVCIWWGAASSKLNRHFPFVVTVMISNTPWNRWRAAKRRLYRDHPEDLRPSSTGALCRPPGHGDGVHPAADPARLPGRDRSARSPSPGWSIFHLHILSTFPLAVPLEWNIFMIFGLLFLFGHYGATSFSTLDDPLLIAILAVTCVGLPVLGNFRPDLVSFLPSMRYYAGNWATSQWLFRSEGGAEAKLDRELVKPAPIVTEQLAKFYDPELIEVLVYKGLAFRSMHSHGRALNGLVRRAVDDVEDYDVREGELVAGVVLGYNFGDGHFHDQRLLAAIQERCGFEPGEVRVVVLESQPAHVQRQRYRIFDAADRPGRGGLGERRRHGRAASPGSTSAVPGHPTVERAARARPA